MSDRITNNFVADNGWTVGNLNATQTNHHPPYQQVVNFANAPPPHHFSSTNVISQPEWKNEHQKFDPIFRQPCIMENNNFQMNHSPSLKQQNVLNVFNSMPPISHNSSVQTVGPSDMLNSLPMLPPVYTKPTCPPVPAVNSSSNRNFVQRMQTFSSGLPTTTLQRNFSAPGNIPFNNSLTFDGTHLNSNSSPSYCNSVSVISQQPLSTPVQSTIQSPLNIPSPIVSSENIPNAISNFRLLPPPFLPPNNVDRHSLTNMMMIPPPPPVYPQIPCPPLSVPKPCFAGDSAPTTVSNPIMVKESLLTAFLEKFQQREKRPSQNALTVVEFRSALKVGLSISKKLLNIRQNLNTLLQCDEKEWNAEIQEIWKLKSELSEVCSYVSNLGNVRIIQKKLGTIKNKRKLKAHLKKEAILSRQKRKQEQEVLHQEIDKWLDGIKEKNLKLKREIEMKKEADKILSEVRKKIHEAKKTIEKLKVFEKLRTARQMSSQQKGLIVLGQHSVIFEMKLNSYRELLHKQLEIYEEEERALRVMLEEEQEGQLEEEVLWRKEKLKSLQKKKQLAILQCLFGDTKDPSPEDPLFLFYQHQNAGNCSIKSLVQIRHHWDDHIVENGDPIPQQWVLPHPPSSSTWESVCQS